MRYDERASVVAEPTGKGQRMAVGETSDSFSQDAATAVSVATETAPTSWQSYLAGRPDATIYHDPRWAAIMQRAYGNRPCYLTASRNGQTVGVLQLVAQKSLLFGSHLCSLPYLDSAGILADDTAARDALVQQARQLRGQAGCDWVELRQSAPLDDSLPARTDKVTLVLSLPADPTVLWDGLKAKVRNLVRKAQKAELTTHVGQAELLDDFYAIYLRNMRDLGSPPHGRRFFESLAESFPQAIRLFVVRSAGRAVGASFTLTDAHALRVPWAGSDWRERQSCPSMLLYWSMLEDSCRRGIVKFDFGRSTRDSGTYQFKTQWGAVESPLFWHYVLPDGEALPDLRPDSPKFRAMVACWKKLPIPLTKILGPRLIAKLS